MEVSEQAQLERAALEAVLQSGIFNRAPNLASFLRYICGRYFEGQADQIKEYSIAVEALGRPADFDQKKDSIVRVEAHRLRKRLAEYYQGPGASHSIHIVVPNGQYAPQFVPHSRFLDSATSLTPGEAVSAVEILPPDPVSSATNLGIVELGPPHGRSLVFWTTCVLVCGVVGAALVWQFIHRTRTDGSAGNETWQGVSTEPVSSEFHMLSGYHGPPFFDRQGRTWISDAYFSGGHSVPIASAKVIQGLPDPGFVKSKREGKFKYNIPLRKGTYELHLYFVETDFGYGNPGGGGETSRLFRISVNGEVTFDLFDALAEAGAPNRLQERVLKDISPGSDGRLHLSFDPITAPAFLNAIEILPSVPGRIRPIRLVSQESSVTDGDGQVWSADQFVIGGHLVVRRDSVVNMRQKPLYEGERYGNFTYHLPVAPGKYRLTLYFAETWFGTPESKLPAVGSRRFNVFANGVALLRNFDIAAEAGGINRGIERVFEDLEPNAQGKIVLEFVPVENYACVNAIQLVETQ